MKHKEIYLVTLFFILLNSFCIGQDMPNGSYSVGFSYYKTQDVSRSYVLNDDTISRPLLIHFWYPANKNIKTDSSYFKDYIDLISIREDYNKPLSEIEENRFNFVNAYVGFAKQKFGIDTTITTNEILDYQVEAQFGIEKSSEVFPLIIYAPSNSKSAVQNHMICEYLASHGYLVISVGSAGNNSLSRNHDQASIMAQVTDMEYILTYFEDSLKIVYSSLGLISFSSGSLASAIFQMKHEKVKALFTMDGSHEYGAYLILSKMKDFDPNKGNVPYCLVTNNYENFSIYPYYNSIASKEKYMFRMPYLGHNGFVSFWKFFGLSSPLSTVNKTTNSYDYISSTALTFFNEYLKSDNLLRSKSIVDFETNEYINRVTTDNSIVAQLGNLMLTDSVETVTRFVTENREILINKEIEIYTLSNLFRDPQIEISIQLLLYNVEMHTNSWQAYFELAYAYKLKGDFGISKEILLKAQQLNPENSEIINLMNELEKEQ